MNLSLYVEVAQRHIAEGQRKLCSHCPIALAITDAFKSAQSVPFLGVRPFVDYYGAMLTVVTHDGEFQFVAGFTQPVKDFIHQFDRGNPVIPFTFPLTLGVRR